MSGFETASEIFALVDVLNDQPMLRRSLSDPSAQPEQRVTLAKKLFSTRVGAEALNTLERASSSAWRSAADLVQGLELDGVRVALAAAQQDSALTTVSEELHAIATTVGDYAELSAILRSTAYELSAKRELIARLIGPDAHPVSKLLAARAIDGHKRTFAKTIDDYLEIAADLTDSVVAKVTLARPLDSVRLERLKAALSARIGKPVSLQITVDPEVLGGVNVAIGHEVYESTVAGRLEEVRRQLINS